MQEELVVGQSRLRSVFDHVLHKVWLQRALVPEGKTNTLNTKWVITERLPSSRFIQKGVLQKGKMEEIESLIVGAPAVLQALHRSVVVKRI